MLKSQIDLNLLEPEIISFIRNVKKEWNHVLSRSKTFEERMSTLNDKQEAFENLMRQTTQEMNENILNSERKLDSADLTKEEESVKISIDNDYDKKTESELKASFKASLKQASIKKSLSKQGSIVTDKNMAAFARESRMMDVAGRIETAEERLNTIESYNQQAFS